MRTSLASSVLCRFTAFVAVDSETVNPDGGGTHVVQPVEAPAGWAETGQVKEAQVAPARKRFAVASSAGALDKAARAPSLAAPAPVEHKGLEKLKKHELLADMSRDEDGADAEHAPAFAQAAAPLGAISPSAPAPRTPPVSVETKGGAVRGMAEALAEVANIVARSSNVKAPAQVQPVGGAVAQDDVVSAGLRALLLVLAQPLPLQASALQDRVHATLLELVLLAAELALTGTGTPLRATLLGLIDLLRSAERGASDAQAALAAVEEQLAPYVPGAAPHTKRVFWR